MGAPKIGPEVLAAEADQVAAWEATRRTGQVIEVQFAGRAAPVAEATTSTLLKGLLRGAGVVASVVTLPSDQPEGKRWKPYVEPPKPDPVCRVVDGHVVDDPSPADNLKFLTKPEDQNISPLAHPLLTARVPLAADDGYRPMSKADVELTNKLLRLHQLEAIRNNGHGNSADDAEIAALKMQIASSLSRPVSPTASGVANPMASAGSSYATATMIMKVLTKSWAELTVEEIAFLQTELAYPGTSVEADIRRLLTEAKETHEKQLIFPKSARVVAEDIVNLHTAITNPGQQAEDVFRRLREEADERDPNPPILLQLAPGLIDIVLDYYQSLIHLESEAFNDAIINQSALRPSLINVLQMLFNGAFRWKGKANQVYESLSTWAPEEILRLCFISTYRGDWSTRDTAQAVYRNKTGIARNQVDKIPGYQQLQQALEKRLLDTQETRSRESKTPIPEAEFRYFSFLSTEWRRRMLSRVEPSSFIAILQVDRPDRTTWETEHYFRILDFWETDSETEKGVKDILYTSDLHPKN